MNQCASGISRSERGDTAACEDRFSDVAMALDRIARQNKVIFTVAAGNYERCLSGDGNLEAGQTVSRTAMTESLLLRMLRSLYRWAHYQIQAIPLRRLQLSIPVRFPVVAQGLECL